jgi:hypothetical protein
VQCSGGGGHMHAMITTQPCQPWQPNLNTVPLVLHHHPLRGVKPHLCLMCRRDIRYPHWLHTCSTCTMKTRPGMGKRMITIMDVLRTPTLVLPMYEVCYTGRNQHHVLSLSHVNMSVSAYYEACMYIFATCESEPPRLFSTGSGEKV